MSAHFCSVWHKAIDRRMTFTVEAVDHEQAKLRAEDIYNEYYPRKVGEIRPLDIGTMRM